MRHKLLEVTQTNYIPITNPETAKGRVIENTMYDYLKQDPTQHQTKVFVELDKIYQGTGTTIFKGHEYAKEFLRSLIRRGRLNGKLCGRLYYSRWIYI